MEDKKVSNPSIPLTDLELQAIGTIRTAKQRSKRLIIIFIPTFLILIVGLAIYSTNTAVGMLLALFAAAGALGGILVIISWSNKIVRRFVEEHQGAFWRKEKSNESK